MYAERSSVKRIALYDHTRWYAVFCRDDSARGKIIRLRNAAEHDNSARGAREAFSIRFELQQWDVRCCFPWMLDFLFVKWIGIAAPRHPLRTAPTDPSNSLPKTRPFSCITRRCRFTMGSIEVVAPIARLCSKCWMDNRFELEFVQSQCSRNFQRFGRRNFTLGYESANLFNNANICRTSGYIGGLVSI